MPAREGFGLQSSIRVRGWQERTRGAPHTSPKDGDVKPRRGLGRERGGRWRRELIPLLATSQRGCAGRRGVTGRHGMSLPIPYSQLPTVILTPGARKPGQSKGRWISSQGWMGRGHRLVPIATTSPELPSPAVADSPLQDSPGLHHISVPQFPYCNTGPVSGGWRGQDGAKGMLVVPREMVHQPEPWGWGGGKRGPQAKAA